jgi:hypothetical protein
MINNRAEAVQILTDWARTDNQSAAAAYDATVKGFSSTGTIPEAGLRLVIDQAKKDAKISRDVGLSEVSDVKILREAQKELGIK